MCSPVCESPSKSGSYLKLFIEDIFYQSQQYSNMQSPQYLRQIKKSAMSEDV